MVDKRKKGLGTHNSLYRGCIYFYTGYMRIYLHIRRLSQLVDNSSCDLYFLSRIGPWLRTEEVIEVGDVEFQKSGQAIRDMESAFRNRLDSGRSWRLFWRGTNLATGQVFLHIVVEGFVKFHVLPFVFVEIQVRSEDHSAQGRQRLAAVHYEGSVRQNQRGHCKFRTTRAQIDHTDQHRRQRQLRAAVVLVGSTDVKSVVSSCCLCKM